jgi:hypothetical protein
MADWRRQRGRRRRSQHNTACRDPEAHIIDRVFSDPQIVAACGDHVTCILHLRWQRISGDQSTRQHAEKPDRSHMWGWICAQFWITSDIACIWRGSIDGRHRPHVSPSATAVLGDYCQPPRLCALRRRCNPLCVVATGRRVTCSPALWGVFALPPAAALHGLGWRHVDLEKA